MPVRVPDEQVRSLSAADGYQVRLHTDRVEFTGGAGARAVWGSMPLTGITAVGIFQRAKDRGLVVWGVLGLIAAAGIWQVASNHVVSTFGSFAVAAISGILLIQYYFRPPGLQLVIQAGPTASEVPVSPAEIAAAREFALLILEARDRATNARPADGGRSRVPRYPIA